MNQKEVSFKNKEDIVLKGVEYIADNEHAILLLVLGLGGNAKSKSVWHFATNLSKKGISLVCYSARGHGESEGLFLFEKNVSDVEELEKKYLKISRKRKINLFLAGHSIGGRSVEYATIRSDVILLNPTFYRGHPKQVSLPIMRRLYLLWWNWFVFRKLSVTHFGDVYFNNESFKNLIDTMSTTDFPMTKTHNRCLLIISSKDVVARYNLIDIRNKVKNLLRARYSKFYHTLILGLDHEFSDNHHTFMKTEKIDEVIKSIELFTRSE